MHPVSDDNGGSERRRHFRIEDQVVISYKVLDSGAGAESENGLDLPGLCGEFACMSRSLERSLRDVRSHSPELSRFIETVNRKVDMLANALLANEPDDCHRCVRPVNLSAGGISFFAEEKLPLDARIWIRLELVDTLVTLGTEARVQRSVYRPGVIAECPHWAAVEFVGLTDSESDLITRHVLRQEAARIRATND